MHSVCSLFTLDKVTGYDLFCQGAGTIHNLWVGGVMGIFSGGGGGALISSKTFRKIRLTTPGKKAQHTIILFVCHPTIFFISFSLGHFNFQEKPKTILMQAFGVTKKRELNGMLGYFLELSIGTLYKGGGGA